MRTASLPRRSNSCSCRTRQQLGLQRERDSPTSSRNSVPPIGQLEPADLLRDRARERAPLVAEELALEEVAGMAAQSTFTNGRRIGR